MADELRDPFCFDEDVDKSFQLVFPARTVDLVAKDAEEATLLAKGFLVSRRLFDEQSSSQFSQSFPGVCCCTCTRKQESVAPFLLIAYFDLIRNPQQFDCRFENGE